MEIMTLTAVMVYVAPQDAEYPTDLTLPTYERPSIALAWLVSFQGASRTRP